MNAKQYNRKVTRTAGGSVADAWEGAKSPAHEISSGRYSMGWRKEWVRRGLGKMALRGPKGKLP